VSLENIVETDVLVIGGGMAGCFAAIKANEQGVDVTLVDKGYVSKSGQTPFAGGCAVFNPGLRHKLDALMDHVSTVGEYVNNRVWTEIVFEDSYARYKDLISWGVKFSEGRGAPPGSPSSLLGTETHRLEPDFPEVLRKQAVKSGVRIMDRIMVTELLKQDGRVVGAIGIPMDSYDLHIFKAKATVISTGAAGFKPAGWPISNLTADGHAMAYRAGTEITGKEFLDTHQTRADYPAARGGMFMGPSRPSPTHPASEARRSAPGRMVLINAEGDEISSQGMVVGPERYLAMEFETHAGRAPLFRHETHILGGAASGMSVHTTEGIWPVNTNCASSLPGLYAAGDSCGTMQTGAVYVVAGSALASASVTGARAGLGAAEYALQAEKPVLDEEELTVLKQSVHTPVERKGGFSPRWVTQLLQNLMIPYFIMYIKHEKRIQATLTLVEFLRDHLVPKLTAKNPHELRLAHETKNMVLNAEMRLRASLFRTESRGTHYREDYPRRDDPNWLAWVLLKEEQGKMKVLKKPIPKEWWPDLSKPYEERYTVRFPGE